MSSPQYHPSPYRQKSPVLPGSRPIACQSRSSWFETSPFENGIKSCRLTSPTEKLKCFEVRSGVDDFVRNHGSADGLKPFSVFDPLLVHCGGHPLGEVIDWCRGEKYIFLNLHDSLEVLGAVPDRFFRADVSHAGCPQMKGETCRGILFVCPTPLWRMAIEFRAPDGSVPRGWALLVARLVKERDT